MLNIFPYTFQEQIMSTFFTQNKSIDNILNFFLDKKSWITFFKMMVLIHTNLKKETISKFG